MTATRHSKPTQQRLCAHTTCNDCGNVIYKHEVFCSKCGKKLDHYDFEE